MRALSGLTRTVVAVLALALPSLAIAPPIAAATHPGSDPSQITAVGTRVFFVATTAAHGDELWVTDGTKAGTHEVADIRTGPFSSEPGALTPKGDKVYFFADDGSGRALWKSDGTAIGTKRLGGGSGQGLTNVNGRLFFYVPGYSDYALWKSDGTVQGTRLVKTMDSIEGPVAGLGGSYYFFSQTYWPEEERLTLWRSDGSRTGTSAVTEILAPLDEEGGMINQAPVEDQMVSSGNHI